MALAAAMASSRSVDRDDRGDGPEDLLLGDAHAGRGVGEHGGGDVVALGQLALVEHVAAREQSGAVVLAPDADVLEHPVALGAADERREVDGLVGARSHLVGAHLLDQRVGEVGVQADDP